MMVAVLLLVIVFGVSLGDVLLFCFVSQRVFLRRLRGDELGLEKLQFTGKNS
jgi:hypothetical protein